MWLEGPLLPIGLWLGTAATGFLYTMLFLLARRPVAIRAGRLANLGLMALALRLLLLAAGYQVETGLDATFMVGTLLVTCVLVLGRRVWIVNAREADLRQQVEAACRGLFLSCDEAAKGQFLIIARGNSCVLRVWSLMPRTQLVLLPPLACHKKVALLVRWLSKQYPGPLPRVCVVLKRRE